MTYVPQAYIGLGWWIDLIDLIDLIDPDDIYTKQCPLRSEAISTEQNCIQYIKNYHASLVTASQKPALKKATTVSYIDINLEDW